jgi:hypothetical protein
MTEQREIVKGVSRPPRREDYEDIVRGLRPFVDGEELMLRSSLLLMRDRAMATKPTACESAWTLLDVVEREASAAAMNHRIQLDDLRELRRLLIMCVCNASSFDTLYQPRLPLDQGEAVNANKA